MAILSSPVFGLGPDIDVIFHDFILLMVVRERKLPEEGAHEELVEDWVGIFELIEHPWVFESLTKLIDRDVAPVDGVGELFYPSLEFDDGHILQV